MPYDVFSGLCSTVDRFGHHNTDRFTDNRNMCNKLLRYTI